MIQIAQRNVVTKLISLVALVAGLMMVLAACSAGGGSGEKQSSSGGEAGSSEVTNSNETVTSFTKTSGGATITLTYYSDGDRVTRQVTKNTLDYAAAGIANKEEAEKTLGPVVEEFQGVAGVEHSIEYGETSLVEKMSVDYSVASITEVARLSGSSFSGEGDENSWVSLKESRAGLERDGYVEVK